MSSDMWDGDQEAIDLYQRISDLMCDLTPEFEALVARYPTFGASRADGIAQLGLFLSHWVEGVVDPEDDLDDAAWLGGGDTP